MNNARRRANQKTEKKLGMSFGAASQKLDRQIMFRLMKKCGEDTCYRCGRLIQSADELSIEHKTAWLNTDSALFWDMNNIAFSHLLCNISAQKNDTHIPSHAQSRNDEGKRVCTQCGKTEDQVRFKVDEFLCDQCTWTNKSQSGQLVEVLKVPQKPVEKPLKDLLDIF